MSDFTAEPDLPNPPPSAPAPPPPDLAPPPGYVPYGAQQFGAFSNFQRVGGLAKAMRVLLIITIPLQLISAVVLFSIRGKARDFLDGSISEDDFSDAATRSNLVGGLTSLIGLGIVVLTMVWMFRLAKNLRSIGRVGTWGPGWAIGGWFLPPCVLYVIPYLMFRDLWKGSDPESGQDWRSNPVGGIVHAWWVLYGLLPIAFVTITLGTIDVGRSMEDIAEDIDNTITLQTVASLVQVAAAVAYLMLVGKLTERHTRLTNEAG